MGISKFIFLFIEIFKTIICRVPRRANRRCATAGKSSGKEG